MDPNCLHEKDHEEALERVISVRVKNDPRQRCKIDSIDLTCSGSTPSCSSVSNSESSDDVFYVYNPATPDAFPDKIESSEPEWPRVRQSTLSTLPNGLKKKHCNLDTKQLSLSEKLRLLRIHYVNVSNIIRVILVTICISLFAYQAKTIVEQYTKFETSIVMESVKPNWTQPPAITICTHCVLCGYGFMIAIAISFIWNNVVVTSL